MRILYAVFLIIVMMPCLNFGKANEDRRESNDRKRRMFHEHLCGIRQKINGQNKRKWFVDIFAPGNEERERRSDDIPHPGMDVQYMYVPNGTKERKRRFLNTPLLGIQHEPKDQEKRKRRSYIRPPLGILHVPKSNVGREKRSYYAPPTWIQRASYGPGVRKIRSYRLPPPGIRHLQKGHEDRKRRFVVIPPSGNQHVTYSQIDRNIRSYRKPPMRIQPVQNQNRRGTISSFWKNAYFKQPRETKQEVHRFTSSSHKKYTKRSTQKGKKISLPPAGLSYFLKGQRIRKRRSYDIFLHRIQHASNNQEDRKRRSYYKPPNGKQRSLISLRLGERRKRSFIRPPKGKNRMQLYQDNRKKRSYDLPPAGIHHVSKGRGDT